MSQKEAKERTLKDVLSEMERFNELKIEARDRIQGEIAYHEGEIAKLNAKLVELGFGPAPTPTTRTRKTQDGEPKQRRCARCSGTGHRYSTCTGDPTAEWLASERGQEFEAKKG